MKSDIELLRRSLAGRYTIDRELDGGASARVYLCEDIEYGRKVALKFLRRELVETVAPDRFLLEIDLAAKRLARFLRSATEDELCGRPVQVSQGEFALV